jgi:hypothetical protein
MRENDVFKIRLENLPTNNPYCARISYTAVTISYTAVTILLLNGNILTLLTTLKVLFLLGNKIGSFVLQRILNFDIKLVACGLDNERSSFMLIFF